MLAGVQHQQQQQLPIGERVRHAVCGNVTGAKLEPVRGGNRGRTRPGLESDENLASHTPSANRGNS
jgi:hypothetical protein